jgi:hypothetical protein
MKGLEMNDNNTLRGVWDRVTGWVDQNATKYTYVSLHKAQTDKNYNDTPLQPNAGYLRLWLSEMFLRKSVAWGIHWFPAVHTEIQLRFGNQMPVVFSHLVQPPQDRLGDGIRLNYPLTDLLPYNGGIVELETALFALHGEDYAATAAKVLQEFSGLIVAPLGQVLNLASKLTIGTRDLLSATHGNVHLGFHQAFTGSSLKPGYIAVILAPSGEIIEQQLFVKQDQLYYKKMGSSQPESLQGYDYMLFYIEGMIERDDLLLKNITDPLQEALTALELGEERLAESYKTLALSAASRSLDLTMADQRRAVQVIKDLYKQTQSSGMGAVSKDVRDLNTLARARAMPVDQALAMGELSPQEVYDE